MRLSFLGFCSCFAFSAPDWNHCRRCCNASNTLVALGCVTSEIQNNVVWVTFTVTDRKNSPSSGSSSGAGVAGATADRCFCSWTGGGWFETIGWTLTIGAEKFKTSISLLFWKAKTFESSTFKLEAIAYRHGRVEELASARCRPVASFRQLLLPQRMTANNFRMIKVTAKLFCSNGVYNFVLEIPCSCVNKLKQDSRFPCV